MTNTNKMTYRDFMNKIPTYSVYTSSNKTSDSNGNDNDAMKSLEKSLKPIVTDLNVVLSLYDLHIPIHDNVFEFFVNDSFIDDRTKKITNVFLPIIFVNQQDKQTQYAIDISNAGIAVNGNGLNEQSESIKQLIHKCFNKYFSEVINTDSVTSFIKDWFNANNMPYAKVLTSFDESECNIGLFVGSDSIQQIRLLPTSYLLAYENPISSSIRGFYQDILYGFSPSMRNLAFDQAHQYKHIFPFLESKSFSFVDYKANGHAFEQVYELSKSEILAFLEHFKLIYVGNHINDKLSKIEKLQESLGDNFDLYKEYGYEPHFDIMSSTYYVKMDLCEKQRHDELKYLVSQASETIHKYYKTTYVNRCDISHNALKTTLSDIKNDYSIKLIFEQLDSCLSTKSESQELRATVTIHENHITINCLDKAFTVDYSELLEYKLPNDFDTTIHVPIDKKYDLTSNEHIFDVNLHRTILSDIHYLSNNINIKAKTYQYDSPFKQKQSSSIFNTIRKLFK